MTLSFDLEHTGAFLWWNEMMYDEKSDNVPDIIDQQEAIRVWQVHFPVICVMVKESTSNDIYWSFIGEFMNKFIENDRIEDPFEDFSNFVLKLYKYRETLSMKDINSCISFVEAFCSDDPVTFFTDCFLVAVSDPMLCVRTMHELHRVRNSCWNMFLDHYGIIERLFDVFITFLQPSNSGDDEEEYGDFRLIVADLIASLLVDTNRNLVLGKEIVAGFFSRLLNLINYSKPIDSISYARIAIRLNNHFLDLIPIEEAAGRVSALLSSSPPGKAAHHVVAQYSYSLCGKFISKASLANVLSKQGACSLWDFNLLKDLAVQSGNETKMIVVRFLSKTLTCSKIYTRLSATILNEILKDCDENSPVCEWSKQFITRLFCFIKLSSRKEKYMRRIHSICDIISSHVFSETKFLLKAIFQNANSAYLIGNEPQFFSDYFRVGESQPKVKHFSREFEKFDGLKMKLKSFPFKIGSTQLLEHGRSKNKGKNRTKKDVEVDESLKETGLSYNALKYVLKDMNASTIDQQQCIFTLEDFIDQEKEKYDNIKIRQKYSNKLVHHNYRHEGKAKIVALRYIIAENENEIAEYQRSALSQYIDIAREIIGALRQHPYLMADIKKLNLDLNLGCGDDPSYKRLKDHRLMLQSAAKDSAKAYIIPNYSLDLQAALTTSFIKFDPVLQYSPPSEIDALIMEYLKKSLFDGMIDATAEVIEDGTIDAAVSTIWELNGAIIDNLGLRMDATALITYTSLVRQVFSKAYTVKERPVLRSYEKSSIVFLKKCEEFCNQPISELNLSEELIGRRKKAAIYSLFRSKVHNLSAIEFMTNPIDMLYHIHQAVLSLPAAVNAPKLTPPETQILLLALVTYSPPSNAIAIYKFLKKWGTLMMSPDVQKSKQLFFNSINHLMSADDIADE